MGTPLDFEGSNDGLDVTLGRQGHIGCMERICYYGLALGLVRGLWYMTSLATVVVMEIISMHDLFLFQMRSYNVISFSVFDTSTLLQDDLRCYSM